MTSNVSVRQQQRLREKDEMELRNLHLPIVQASSSCLLCTPVLLN